MARSTGSGRGFTGDRLILDEAQHLGWAALGAILPTMSARPNPQVWYAATAPDFTVAPCDVLARLRKRAQRGDDPSLVYAEWSVNAHEATCAYGCGEHDDPASVRSWASANPALGIRISVEHVAREFAAMDATTFARERLGVGRWPADAEAWQVISAETWQEAEDRDSQAGDVVAFAADVTPDRSWGAISVAGRRIDDRVHVEVVEHRPRTSWMVSRLLELRERWRTCAVVIDPTGQAGSLIAPLEEAGVEVVKPSAREMGQACGQFYEAVTDSGTLRHLGQPELATALAGAQRRPLQDAWAWSRKDSTVDITPLVTATLAVWGHTTQAHLLDDASPSAYVF